MTRSNVTENLLVNALHAFHRFNRRYHVKNIEGNCTPDYDIVLETRVKTSKAREMLETNVMKVLRKIVGKTKKRLS